MKVTIINPNNVTQKGDFFGTGIPYLPIIPAYLASYLKKKGHEINVIDAFGEKPQNKRKTGNFIVQGLDINDILNRIGKTDLICLYAGHVVEHFVIIELLKKIQKKYSICIIENSQAVTAYSVRVACKEFFDAGADYVIYGEPEKSVELLLSGGFELKPSPDIPGLIYKNINKNGITNKNKIIINPRGKEIDLDILPFPAWDLFPLENYWKLGYSHAPFQGKYLPLLTSRGCPYQCEFCIIPFTNNRQWRARSPKNVVSEIKSYVKKYNVHDFHIEDLNPTLDPARIISICRLILKEKLEITFKFASGVKLETIDEKTMKLLAKAGCNYLSFSPESGSKSILKKMKKPFDYGHGLKMTSLMNKLGIKSQACFVIGFIGETKNDREQTKKYLMELADAGLDEVALFVMTPIPGSKPYEKISQKNLSKLTFSPTWRREYKELNKFRNQTYLAFFMRKLRKFPLKMMSHPLKLISGSFDVKMEMTLYRLFKTFK